MKNLSIPFCGEFTAITERDFANAERVCQLIGDHDNAFSRHLEVGHITASAFLVDEDSKALLMTHHAKLDRWLQLGGHCDGIKDTFFVAKKEAYEESGLLTIRSPYSSIFDIDIHPIPARKSDPEHLHFDIRYLFFASQRDAIQVSEESVSLKWIPLDKLKNYTDDVSILKPLEKLDSFILKAVAI